MKRNRGWLAGAVLAIYIALLAALVYAESSSPEATIHSLGQAVWYSLVTVTTVGYGELYPVTPVGRMVGAIFLLMSAGMLSLLIGVFLSLLFGRLVPAVRFFRARRKPWYLFSAWSGDAAALCENLVREAPDSLFVFLYQGEKPVLSTALAEDPRCLCYNGPMEDVLRIRADHEKTACFFTGPDGFANYQAALRLRGRGAALYVQSDYEPDDLPLDMTLFDRCDCCSRLFWQKYPLRLQEHCILIVGGRAAEKLLERALLTNILAPEQQVEYHLFGAHEVFRADHYGLSAAVAVDTAADAGDAVFFETALWNSDPALLCRADRIIFAFDTDEENLSALRQAERYFALRGEACALCSVQVPGSGRLFGSSGEIYTPDLVMRTSLDRLARRMNEIYRARNPGAPAWEELSSFFRGSNIAAADHLLVKVRILLQDDSITAITPELCRKAYERYKAELPARADWYRRLEHLRWMRFYAMYNWQYAPERDNAARLHPSMRDFEALTVPEQAKDDYAWELLGELGREP